MRFLKVAVIVMGVLLVGGTVALVVLLAQRMQGPSAASAPAMLDEPAGTRIVGASAAPDRVVVQLQGGGPDRVVVFDTRTGKILTRVTLAR